MTSKAKTDVALPFDLPKLRDGWRYVPLAQLIDAERGISYGIVQPGKEDKRGIPIIRVNAVKNGRIDTQDPLMVSVEVEAKHQRTKLMGGEVILTLVGTVGESAIVPPELAGWNVARAIAVLPVAKGVSAAWLHICLRSPLIQHYIRSWCTTTVQATFNLRDVARLPIPIAPKEDEEKIVQILGALDEKIDLNRQMNNTLETTARTIFESWFVNFDPVRAKAEGRQPFGMDSKMAALFPDSFEESKMGQIPRGWAYSLFSDIIQNTSDRVVPSEEIRNKPYVPIECIASRSLSLNEFKSGSEAQTSLIGFRKNDILFGAMRPYFHKVCIAPFNGTTRTTVFVLRPKENELMFAAMLASHNTTVEFATLHSEGSTIPYAKWKNSMEKMPVVLPSTELRAAFNNFTLPLFQRCMSNNLESHILAELRDTLLPKLLSGEIRLQSELPT